MNKDTEVWILNKERSNRAAQQLALAGGSRLQVLTQLKQQPGQQIGVTGSATLVRSLLRERLLDELWLTVYPIVVGSGKRLFPDGCDRTPLKLASSRTFSIGVLSLMYQPAEG